MPLEIIVAIVSLLSGAGISFVLCWDYYSGKVRGLQSDIKYERGEKQKAWESREKLSEDVDRLRQEQHENHLSLYAVADVLGYKDHYALVRDVEMVRKARKERAKVENLRRAEERLKL